KLDVDLDLGDATVEDFPNAKWELFEGPSSPRWLPTDPKNLDGELSGPTVGGLYKVRLVLNPNETDEEVKRQQTCIAQLLLPYAGNDIADWLIQEARYIAEPGGMAEDWQRYVIALAEQNGWETHDEYIPVGTEYYIASYNPDQFVQRAFTSVAAFSFDYFGVVGIPTTDPQHGTARYSYHLGQSRLTDPVRDPLGPGPPKEWMFPAYSTINGVVVSRGRLNSALFGVWGRACGNTLSELKEGANMFRFFVHWRLHDTPASARSIDVGSALYEAVLNEMSNQEIRAEVLAPENVFRTQDEIPSDVARLEPPYFVPIYRLNLQKLLWPSPFGGSVAAAQYDWGEDGGTTDTGEGYTRPLIFLQYENLDLNPLTNSGE
ncbi:MAG: hypothetical protein HY706_10105, partial [Candidatus Hydrogenedentes bacterium]|nr:hypothetical protein [Candidatus Hydrogenedentota bacterium]